MLNNSGVNTVAGGNPGTGTTASNSYAVDTRRPTASIVVSDTALAVGETSLVTFTFSEAVTGFAGADLTVPNGSLAGLSSSDGGVTWTATLTPTASIEDTTNLIALDNTGVADAAGNTGTGTTNSNNYAIDTLRPSASITVSDTTLTAGETSAVTITFNEAVTGLTGADFTVGSGALSGLSSSDGGITWTATLTPAASTSATGARITLDNTGYSDGAGNTGTGSTQSNAYDVQTSNATVTIVVADTSLIVGETSAVTFTFSEAVSGLDVSDLTVANGGVTAPSSSDGGTVWTATLTPAANVEASSNTVVLNNSGVNTVAGGNPGTGTTASNSYAVDTRRPTASIVVSDGNLELGETSPVTISFSEPVIGFDNTDLTVPNATLSAVTSSDGGTTWTATLSPAANTFANGNVISLQNSGISDAAGNAGAGTSASNAYVVNTARYTVGGQVSGLNGTGLILRNNGADDLSVSANGGFSFATPLASAAAYSVTVAVQPSGPAQTCSVTQGQGTIAAANVSNVLIDCANVNNLPGEPRNISGSVGDRSITVQWQAPDSAGGSAIIDYTATALTPTPAKGAAAQCTTASLSCVITGLTNGTAYTLQVSARNSHGIGPNGVGAASVMPLGPPGMPTQVQVQIVRGAATVNWLPPADTGGTPITSYTVTATPSGLSCTVTGNPPPTTCQIDGLRPDTTYSFNVVAHNAVGAGNSGAGAVPVMIPAVLIPVGSPWSLVILSMLLMWMGQRKVLLRIGGRE